MNRRTDCRKCKQLGFTLIEMLVVMAIMTVIMAAIFAQVRTAQQRSFMEQQKMDLFQETREFVDTMTRDIRNAGYPNSRNFSTTPPKDPTDPSIARGLLYAGPGDVWLEADVEGNGVVSVVKYHLDANGTNCPCLRRSKVAKGTVGDDYAVEVQFVQNGTLANPIFEFYDINNNKIDLSSYTGNVLDGTTATNPDPVKDKLGSIQTVKMEVSSQARYADLQTRQRPILTLNSYATIQNCSLISNAGNMNC